MSKLNNLKDEKQRLALNKWYANGCVGTLELCTSFGKTRTALLAAEWVLKQHISYEKYKAIKDDFSKLAKNPNMTDDEFVKLRNKYKAKVLLLGINIIVVTPTQVIRDETWRDECNQWGLFPEYDLGVIQTTCIQTAYKLTNKEYDLVILDEAHNYISVEDNFDPKYEDFFKYNNIKRLLGLTASIPENKRSGFAKLCPVVYQMDLIEAVNLGLVAPFNIVNIPVALTDDEKINYDKLSKIIKRTAPDRKKTCPQASHRRKIVNQSVNKLELAKYLVDDVHSSQQFITFGENIETAYKLFKSANDRSRYYSSVSKELKTKYDDINLTKKQRDLSLQEFCEGKKRGMCSARALNEGINVPKVDVAVILSRTSSDKDIIQRIGRVVRLSDNPNKVATIYNIYVENTVDESWLDNSLYWIYSSTKFSPEKRKTWYPIVK